MIALASIEGEQMTDTCLYKRNKKMLKRLEQMDKATLIELYLQQRFEIEMLSSQGKALIKQVEFLNDKVNSLENGIENIKEQYYEG